MSVRLLVCVSALFASRLFYSVRVRSVLFGSARLCSAPFVDPCESVLFVWSIASSRERRGFLIPFLSENGSPGSPIEASEA